MTATIIIYNREKDRAELHFDHIYNEPPSVVRNIIYKSYDGTDLNITDPNYPKTYTESVGIPLLPTVALTGWIPSYGLYGLYDCTLDQSKKIPIGIVGYEGEESLNFDIGNKITSMPSTQTGDVTLYLRP